MQPAHRVTPAWLKKPESACHRQTPDKEKEITMMTFRIPAIMGLALLSLTGVAWAEPTAPATPDRPEAQMPEHMRGMGGMMGEGMLAMPEMHPERGRKAFAEKGCVVCHSINGIGGEDAPALDASTMQRMMNPFEFAAKMWDGAEVMVMMQRDELGEPIRLSGEDLADIIAFVHNHEEQAKFTEADIPENIRELMDHGHEEGEGDDGHKK